jgi:hypothetical protein
MAYRTTKRGEVQQLQYEVGREIVRDAPEIAKQVFGDNSMHPDMATISNAELDALFRQKYLTNDRTWLQAEARRDPEQFLAVAQRIGVQLPPSERVDGELPPPPAPNALGKALVQNVAPPPPVAPVAPPIVTPAVVPTVPVAPTAPVSPQLPLPGMPPSV